MKVIVTTTIQPPTEATIRFSKMPGWHLVVVADQKTPHDLYKEISCTYLTIEEQNDAYRDLSEYIGWNKIERRNLGYVKAYNMGATVVATVDDDNIPYSDWGLNVQLDKDLKVDMYENINGVFDPLSVTNKGYMWHRGYPLQLVNGRHENVYLGQQTHKFLVQADLWNGEPDIDAIYRLTHSYPQENFQITGPYSSVNISPFNSQNTFIDRSVLHEYMMPVNLGRIHDIWAAYRLQKKTGAHVLYNKPSVYQRRNVHSIIEDYKSETSTYHLSLDFIEGKIDKDIEKSIETGFEIYQKYFI